ncbi:MAG: type II toxin-antitoxin system RelB/DinJ family antitoxin [Kiritimatiellaeota bacterium]|nr:type II toxin-antitoxin system RelB/DinJ family antitoxin [Kiritimatiellota bacterium]
MTSNITIRLDSGLKQEAESLFNSLGMNLTTAVNIFFRQSIRDQCIPFPITQRSPNAETIAAIEEGRRIARDPKTRVFTNMEDLIKELNT